MRAILTEGLREDEGRAYDASALVLLACRPNEPALFRALIPYFRPMAVKVLNDAGYCSCGTRLEAPRCPQCSTLHETKD
jgi:hypothetical protein